MDSNDINVGASSTNDALHRSPGVVRNMQGCRAFTESDAPCRRPGVVLSEQGFPHHGRVWVKKLVHRTDSRINSGTEHKIDIENNRRYHRRRPIRKEQDRRRIRVGTWNVGSLTGKLMELVDTLERRRVNIACIQETKWVGEKSKEVGNSGYKLWFTGKERNKNGVGIIIDRTLKDAVVAVKRVGDRIILVKLVLEGETINIISAYAPQIGLDSESKQKFWEDMDDLMQSISNEENVFIGGDLNGHVGSDRQCYENVHGGFGFGSRNEEGKSILDFAMAYDLILANTYFIKRESHLVTFKSGQHRSQIDFLLTRKTNRALCKDCKVIPGEALTSQHRLVVLDVKFRNNSSKVRRNSVARTKWWEFKGVKQVKFKNELLESEVWKLDMEANDMWIQMASKIREVARKVLGESKGHGPPSKERWWWNEEVQKAVKRKREWYKKLPKCDNNEAYEQYKIAKKEAKKAVSQARAQAFEKLYEKLGTKEGEKDIYRLARSRERKCQDLNQVRCIKDKEGKVLVKDEDIKERWRNYFNDLFNNSQNGNSVNIDYRTIEKNVNYTRRIRSLEVKEALKRMKVGKACGPDEIPIEVWKYLGDMGVAWLTKLFNKILNSKKMLDEWKKSTQTIGELNS